MATFKAVVKRPRSDGFYPVYIRVTHHRKSLYIKTDKMLTKRELTSGGEITDPFVLQFCTQKILEYQERLNRHDISQWTGAQIVEFLTTPDEVVSFSEYARKHINRLIDNGQERSAKNYKRALQHMERYFGTTNVKFSDLTSVNVNKWIATLSATARAKEMYPVCIRQIFRAAIDELNDYDTGLIRIKNNPWGKVKIPQADKPNQKAITAEECRAFFAAPLPESKMKEPLAELGRDVAMLSLCLAGMNTVDIYRLRKEDYRDGIIHYKRSKTKRSRKDEAYIEMRVPEIIRPLFDKYGTGDDSDRLFRFAERFSTPDSFCSNVNIGIKQICASMGIAEPYCVYTFRHTWATTAQNDCGASLAEIGFAMNHSKGYSVTRGYVKLDFSPAWKLNEKVIDFIFFSDKASKRAKQTELMEIDGLFRMSPKALIRGEAFFMGRRIAHVEDIGYSTIEQVEKDLVDQFPDDIPLRSTVMFKITIVDSGKVHIHQRMKGVGF